METNHINIHKYVWSWFSGNCNILKVLLSPVRFTKCLGVRVPLRPLRKKALIFSIAGWLRTALFTARYVILWVFCLWKLK
jgi:hypothetical protein